MLISKQLLIFIVASWKLYSKYRQIGVTKIQIWSKRRHHIYRSLDPAKFWTKSRLKNALTMAMLTYKLPLIVIVASGKLYNE